MNKKIYFLGILILLGIKPVSGAFNSHYTDSLIRQLHHVTKDQKVELYNHIARSYLPDDPQNCILYAGKALKSARNNDEQKAFAFKNLGAAYYNLYQYDNALTYYFGAKDLFSKQKDQSQIAALFINIGLVYREKNDYVKARDAMTQSLETYQKLHDEMGMANALNMLGSLARRQGNLKEALQYYTEALKTRIYLNHPDDIAASLSNVALIYKESGNADTAIQYYQNALAIRTQNKEKPQIANTLNEIGNVYWGRRDFEKALEYYFRSVKIRYEIGDNSEIANSYQNIGNLFSKLGNSEKSRAYYLQALKLYMNGGDMRKLSSLLTVLGNLEYASQNYQDALDYFGRALNFRKKIGEKKDIATSYNSLANVYAKLDKNAEAGNYFHQALLLRQEIHDTTGLIVTTNDLGNLYENEKNPTKALACFQNAFRMAQKKANTYYIGLCARKIAEYDISNNHPEQATPLIQLSQDAGAKLKNAELLEMAHYAWYEQYVKLKQYLNALKNYQIYAKLKDSVMVAHNSLKMMTIQQNLELEKKDNDLKSVEHEVNTLRHEKELQSLAYLKQRYILIFLIILVCMLFIIGGLLYNRYITRKKHNYELQLQYAELEQKNSLLIKSESELSKLNALKDRYFSIIAHDIRNPLSALLSLSSLIREKSDSLKGEEVREFNNHIYKSASNLNYLLENLLNWARSNTDRLKYNPVTLKISQIADNVISLNELVARQKNILIENKIAEKIEVTADLQMVHLILRNLMTNAIKFTNPGGKVTVSAIEALTHVEITVQDNGIGISHADQEKLFGIETNYTTFGTNREAGTGLGLVLVKEFVEKNKGRVFVNSVPGKGSTFTFTLPI